MRKKSIQHFERWLTSTAPASRRYDNAADTITTAGSGGGGTRLLAPSRDSRHQRRVKLRLKEEVPLPCNNLLHTHSHTHADAWE
jgi:hypothetical protein